MKWIALLDDADRRSLAETLRLPGDGSAASGDALAAALAVHDSDALCMLRADRLAALCEGRGVASWGSKRQRVERLLGTLNAAEMENEDDADEVSLIRAPELVVAGFMRHWRKVLRRVRRGEDVAAERAERFLAVSAPARLRIARRFYGEEHAARMAALEPAAVRELLAPWIDLAVDPNCDAPNSLFWLRWERPGESKCRSLSTSEYVMVVESHAGGVLVDRFPGDDACYDDIYERVASGYSTGGRVRLFKATGEPFTAGEARSAYAMIRTQLLCQAGAEEGDQWDADGPEFVDNFQVVMWVQERGGEDDDDEDADADED